MKTRSIKKEEVSNKWYVLDLNGVRLGRAAQKIASVLIGKGKVEKVDYLLSGDKVIVINSDKVDYYPTRETRKKYYSHSGFPGGLTEISLGNQMKKDSTQVIRSAVWGMLPKTKMGRKMYKNLVVYKGEDFVEKTQNPEKIVIK